MVDVIVSIGILTAKSRIGVKGNLIIVAIESICQIIVGIQKFISVSVDLKINIAVLHAKVIVIAIDWECDRTVTNVDSVVIARDADVALFVLDVLLTAVVIDVHPTNYYTWKCINYFGLERKCDI